MKGGPYPLLKQERREVAELVAYGIALDRGWIAGRTGSWDHWNIVAVLDGEYGQRWRQMCMALTHLNGGALPWVLKAAERLAPRRVAIGLTA